MPLSSDTQGLASKWREGGGKEEEEEEEEGEKGGLVMGWGQGLDDGCWRKPQHQRSVVPLDDIDVWSVRTRRFI